VWFARPLAPPSPTANACYRTAPYVAAGRCENATFLLNKKTGRYFKLDDVGSELWALLRQSPGLDRQQILQSLSQIYEMEEQSIAADVTALITRLVGDDVIEVDSEMPQPC
jgi:Coenzyme PQQ synthesis protein D (PqqD)